MVHGTAFDYSYARDALVAALHAHRQLVGAIAARAALCLTGEAVDPAYDCYTVTVIVTLEDAGFCPKGRGGPFVEEHDLTCR
jgi:hypothetical protein